MAGENGGQGAAKKTVVTTTEKPGEPQPPVQEDTKVEPIEKVVHANIFAALAAFQGENPKIERTKTVEIEMKDNKGKYSFTYAPLDHILHVVRPLLAKHGLSFVHINLGEPTTAGNYRMQCVLYHETYERKSIGNRKIENYSPTGAEDKSIDLKNRVEEPMFEEINIIRSMPITVTRTGDMKNVGSESTYARRYTFCEVTGIASEEDNDVAFENERQENVEDFAMKQAKKQIAEAQTHEKLTEVATFFDKELKTLEGGKVPSLGFKKEQYEELMKLVTNRRTQLGKPKEGGEKVIDATA